MICNFILEYPFPKKIQKEMLIFEIFGNFYVKSFDYSCYVQTYQPHIFNTTSNTLWIFFTDMKILVSFATFFY